MEIKRFLLSSNRIKSIVVNGIKYENDNYNDNIDRNDGQDEETTDEIA